MGGKLNVFGLGSLGVNVDKNPFNLEDGELTKAQNAIHDPLGSMGGLRKRRGLTKLNSVAGAGSIKGGTGVPLGIGTAGNTGGALTPSPAVDPTTRTLYQARHINSTTTGWNTTTDNFATSPTTGGPDGFDANGTPRVPNNLWAGVEQDTTHHKYRALWSGRPSCMYQNRMYYAGNDYTSGSSVPTATASIRMFDGTTDYLIGRIQTASLAVIDMIVGGDNMIYFTVHISGVENANTMVVKVFQLNPISNVIKQIGAQFPLSPETVRVPFTLLWHMGRLWTRTHGGGISATSHLVYYIRPDVDTAWTLETPGDGEHSTNCMASFQGQIFMGIVKDVVTAAIMKVRSALGVYSTSKTVALNEGSGTTMTSFGYSNGFGAMAVFGGNLYASYWNQEGASGNNTGVKYARIYKFDGSSWTLVYSPAGDDADCVPYTQAIVIGGKLYFVSAPARTSSNTTQRILYTSNGSAFTGVGSVLDDASGGFLGGIAS